MRNILKQSIDKEIQEYQRIVQKYKVNDDYCNPNVPLSRALEIIKRLQKEKYLGYKID